ncbi:MAG: chromophore lyase CpcT/CpeT [Lewinellaceae bacterium]|nr:chromophore lyase CpcT/CpeT [Saprospiraceae bacterium]MCB9341270.1 chromophore lyase CpcT/CpeT [Lewinellaceae bacterium]
MMSLKPISLLLLAALLGCAISKKTAQPASDLERLQSFMAGDFNSAAQAASDSNYYDITLHMHPIWKGRPGHWLYVEQAITANQAKPYRQRVYQLEQMDANTFRSSVYTIKDEKAWVNAWQTPEKFDALTLNGIELKAGCEVVLKKDGANFTGSTGDRTCPSELRGATYATSKVTVYPTKIISWDQGFDDSRKQVWGATAGGYVFVKY